MLPLLSQATYECLYNTLKHSFLNRFFIFCTMSPLRPDLWEETTDSIFVDIYVKLDIETDEDEDIETDGSQLMAQGLI